MLSEIIEDLIPKIKLTVSEIKETCHVSDCLIIENLVSHSLIMQELSEQVH